MKRRLLGSAMAAVLIAVPATAQYELSPEVRDLKIAPSLFVRADRVATVARRAGTSIRFELSEPARVDVTFERLEPRRAVVPGGLSFDLGAGEQRIRFFGRIGDRALPNGRYRMTLVATNAAGTPSAPAEAEIVALSRTSYRAVMACRRAIDAQPTLGDDIAKKLKRICIEVGLRPHRARAIARRTCATIIRATVPAGTARRQALRACKHARFIIRAEDA